MLARGATLLARRDNPRNPRSRGGAIPPGPPWPPWPPWPRLGRYRVVGVADRGKADRGQGAGGGGGGGEGAPVPRFYPGGRKQPGPRQRREHAGKGNTAVRAA